MNTYPQYLFLILPYLVFAILGTRLLRRRWPKNPEACSMICWGLGLVILSKLRQAGVNAFNPRAFAGIYGLRFDDFFPGDRAWYSNLQYVVSTTVDCISLWVIVLGALRLFDSTTEEAGRLTAGQARALLPLIRRSKQFVSTEEMVITDREVAFRRIHDGKSSEPTLRFEFGVPQDAVPKRLSVLIEQVGLVGPDRHKRRFRFTAAGTRKDFFVAVADYTNVRDVLEELSPGCVVEEERPLRSWWDRMILLSTVFFIMINLGMKAIVYLVFMAILGRSPDAHSGEVSLGVYAILMLAWLGPLTILLIYLMNGWTALFSKNRPPRPFVKKRTARGLSKQPLRSWTFGWLLKICSLLLAIMLIGASPIERWDRNNEGDTPVILTTLFGMACVLMMAVGNRLCQKVFAPGDRIDPRAPLLFLRAFDDDDRRTLQPNGWLAKFFGIPPDFGTQANGRSALRLAMQFHPIRMLRMFLGLPTDTVEELLSSGFSKVGPLVAIGQPGEAVTTSGAQRMYVPDEVWQSVVLDYLNRSAGIILQPGYTAGVIWEIRRTFETVPKKKILLSMVNYQGHPQAFEAIWLLLHEECGVALPRSVPFLDRPGFVYFGADGTSYLQPVIYNPVWKWPLLGNAVNVESTLTPYISSLESDQPHNPVPVSRFGAVSVIAGVLLSAGLIFFIPFALRMISIGVLGLMSR